MGQIFLVGPENVTGIWPQIVPMLDPVLEITGTHEAEDVRKMLMTHQAHLWLQFEPPNVEAFVISEFVNYPRGLWLRLWAAGAARGVKADWKKFSEVTRAWGDAHHCVGDEIIGRVGWGRLFPEAKFSGVVLRRRAA